VVVTFVCLWLAWQVRIVRERQRLWQLINERGGYTRGQDAEPVSTIRAMLGDKPCQIIALPEERFTTEQTAEIKAAFPESIVHRDPEKLIHREGDEAENQAKRREASQIPYQARAVQNRECIATRKWVGIVGLPPQRI